MKSKLLFVIFLLAIGGSASAQLALFICSPQLPCPGFPLGSVQAGVDQNGWRHFKLTLTQNVTLFSFVGTPPPAQGIVNVIFTQDATGGRTVTFASNISNPCTITAAANSTTLCQFEFDGTTGVWIGVVSGGTPGAPSGSVQVNNSGAFGGIASAGSGSVVLANGTAQLKWTTDVRDKGIDCTGATDSTTAFQNMINAAPDYSSITIPQNCLIKVSGTPAITINQRNGLQFIGQGRSANFCGLSQSGFTYNQTYASGNTIFNINQSQQMLFQNITVFVNGNADVAWNVDQATSPPITTDNVWIDVCVRNAINTPNPAFKGWQISKVSQSNVESMQLIRPWVECANGVPTSSSSNGIGIWFGTSPNQKDEIVEDAKFGNCSIGISFGGGSAGGSDVSVTGGLDSTSWINFQAGGFNTLLSGIRAEGVSGGGNGSVVQETNTTGPFLLMHNDFAGRTVAAIDCPTGCANTTLISNESDTAFGNWFNVHGNKQGVLFSVNDRNSEYDPYDWRESVVFPGIPLHGTGLAGLFISAPTVITPNATDCGAGSCGSPLIMLDSQIASGSQTDRFIIEAVPNQVSGTTTSNTLLVVQNVPSPFTPWVALQGQQTGAIYAQSPTPTGLSVATRGAAGGTTYTYQIVGHGSSGTTPASAAVSITTGNSTLSTSNFNFIQMPPCPGCTFFDVYRTACGGVGICNTNPTGKIGSITTASITNFANASLTSPEPNFSDTGLAGDATTAPATNTTGQIQSTVPTGLAPLSITSTTPVANLTVSNHPLLQACGTTTACSHAATTNGQIVFGSVALTSGTPSTATVTGFTPAFTSTSTFVCTCTNATTQANPVKVVNASASSITITGPNTVTDTINYECVGN